MEEKEVESRAEFFKRFAESEDNKRLIMDGSVIQGQINPVGKEKMKQAIDDYIAIVLESDPKMQSLYFKKKKSKDEKKQVAAWIGTQKRRFLQTLQVLFALKVGANNPVTAIAQKLVAMAKMLQYLGNHDLESLLSGTGIHITVDRLEDDDSWYDEDGNKKRIQDCIDRAMAVKSEIFENEREFKEDIFESIAEDFKYSKENPKGIKVGQFKKLARTKLKEQTSSKEEFEEFRNKMVEKDEGQIASTQLVVETVCNL